MANGLLNIGWRISARYNRMSTLRERKFHGASRCAILLTIAPGVVGKAVLDEGLAAVTAHGRGVFDSLAALRAGFADGRARKH